MSPALAEETTERDGYSAVYQRHWPGGLSSAAAPAHPAPADHFPAREAGIPTDIASQRG